MTTLLPLLLAIVAAPAAALAGMRRTGWAALAGIALAGLAFAATLWGWLAGGGGIDLAWAPAWNLRLIFALDGLAALYALLATGIGVLILVYSSGYLPLHLAEEGQPAEEGVSFYAFVLLFMGSMVGLVMAQDLLLIFIFWDLTAIASYYLIGFDRHKNESREAALMALLVTGITSVLFLIGALMLFVVYQTFSLPELFGAVQPGSTTTVALGLMAVAALAKSAQVPLHFWLPRAMAAPTPVSAYLHSAAMVAAGVFLLQRLYPLLQMSPLLLNILLTIGLLSMAVAGVLALTRDVLKQLLAYSTIAQYGYIVVMLGLGGREGAVGASFYVFAHALLKSALFLTAGAVTQATHQTRLSRLGGLWRTMPALAIASGVISAGLAGLPLTIGFFKDEVFFAAAVERGWPFSALAVIGAAFTLAYIWRFWRDIFLGAAGSRPHPIPGTLVWPVVGLGLLALVAGIAVRPIAYLAQAAATVTLGAPAPVKLAYHLDARPENLMALATYLLGIGLIISRPLWDNATAAVARLGERAGPERWYRAGLVTLNRLSTRLYRLETRDMANRIAAILIPAAALIALGLLATPANNVYKYGAVEIQDIPLILALLATLVAGLVTTLPKNHLTQVLALSSVGYCLVVVYTLYGAPDVALVAVLMGTMSVLFFLGILALFPREALKRQAARSTSRWLKRRDLMVGMLAGAFTFIVSWNTLSQSAARENVAVRYANLTPDAHAADIVTAILADFRGLDTMGEITVIGVALVGVLTLLGWKGMK